MPGSSGSRGGRRFQPEAESRARLPVVVVSGFLGSGKTTLVNALLAQDAMAGTAVAVNEFGEMPLDRNFAELGPHSTVVLANGCLCCNLGNDMEAAVMRLFSRREDGDVPAFRRLIIEPSGLSDPTPIAQSILRNPLLARTLRLEAIVTTVDGGFGAMQLARHGEMRPQIAMADHLLITKPDLADAAGLDDLRQLLRRHNPLAPISVVRDGVIPAGAFLPAGFLDPTADTAGRGRSLLSAEAVAPGGGHLDGVASVSLHAGQALAWPAFDAWLRGIRLGHADAMLRVKGMMDIAGHAGPVLLDGIHHVLHTPVELQAWPAGERQSRLVVIADAPTCASIQARWAAELPALLA
jgi:G3E family GTPase